jgi:type I restriction enzyme S subunit
MTAPKLRFKEFGGDWSNKKIGNIASKVGSGSTPRGGSEAYTDHGVIFIRSQNVNNDQLLLDDVAYIPEETHLKMSGSKVIANDVLLNITGASIGRSCVVPHDFTEANVNQHVCIIRTPNDDPIFVQSFLSSENGQNAIQSKQAGGGREGLNFQAIRAIDFHFPPSKEEQTKIASFLSVVDEKISQLTQKHELLSQYKQGMMQKLFSQQIRFKADDGSEFGEWEEKRLIDSVDTNIKWSFTGGPFGSNLKSEDYTESGIRIIQLQNIGDGAFLNGYKIYTSVEKANELLSCNIYPEEILISKMGDPVARCCIVPKHHDRYVMCSDGIRLVVDKQNYSSIFMFYQINYQDFRQSASDVSTGSTRKRIGLNDLKQLPIKVPCLEEQTKIANFLSAIDQKIEVVAQQIEQAKQWKKGLLQQMFV